MMERQPLFSARLLLLAPPLLALLAAPALGDTPGSVQARNSMAQGKELFEQICAACHMADARGSGDGAIPALASDANLADPAYPVGVVMNGKGAMPPFADMLTPAQVGAAITYVRTHFGNDYPQPVTEADVRTLSQP